MADTKTYGVRFLPAILIIAVACVAVAAALLAYTGQKAGSNDTDPRELNELLALSQKMPLQAASAVGGNAASFDALSESRARFSTLDRS